MVTLDRRYTFFLILIFALALLLRLIHLESGFFDHASVRSIETFVIAKNFITQGLPIWSPRVDWGGPHGGYVKFELQLYSYTLAFLMKIFGVHEVVGRLFTIFISLGSGWFLYKFLLHFFTARGALAGLTVYLLNPINIYFGRAIQPDALMMFFGILGLWCLVWRSPPRALDKTLGALSIAIAILLKPTAGVFLAPFLLIFFEIHSWRELAHHLLGPRVIYSLILILAIVTPAVMYYGYIDRTGDMSILNHRGWWLSLESLKAYFTTPLFQKYILATILFFNPVGWFFLFVGLALSLARGRHFFIQPTALALIAFGVAMSPQWIQGFHEWHFMPGILGMALVAAKITQEPDMKPWFRSPAALIALYFLFLPPAIYALFFVSNSKPDVLAHNVSIIREYVPEGKTTAVTDPGSTLTNFYSGRIGVYIGGAMTSASIQEIKSRDARYLLVTHPLSDDEKKVLGQTTRVYEDAQSTLFKL